MSTGGNYSIRYSTTDTSTAGVPTELTFSTPPWDESIKYDFAKKEFYTFQYGTVAPPYIPKEVEDKIKAGDMFGAVAALEGKPLCTNLLIELKPMKDILFVYITGLTSEGEEVLIRVHEIKLPQYVAETISLNDLKMVL